MSLECGMMGRCEPSGHCDPKAAQTPYTQFTPHSSPICQKPKNRISSLVLRPAFLPACFYMFVHLTCCFSWLSHSSMLDTVLFYSFFNALSVCLSSTVWSLKISSTISAYMQVTTLLACTVSNVTLNNVFKLKCGASLSSMPQPKLYVKRNIFNFRRIQTIPSV